VLIASVASVSSSLLTATLVLAAAAVRVGQRDGALCIDDVRHQLLTYGDPPPSALPSGAGWSVSQLLRGLGDGRFELSGIIAAVPSSPGWGRIPIYSSTGRGSSGWSNESCQCRRLCQSPQAIVGERKQNGPLLGKSL
jgi:hypothetical protein